MLIHVGINTVELNGKYYEAHVKEGDRVKKGQLLISFDEKAIKKAGYDTVTPVVVCNHEELEGYKVVSEGVVDNRKVIISI